MVLIFLSGCGDESETNINTLPVITSNGGQASTNISLSENQTKVTEITAQDNDQDNNGFTFELSGGEDQALFSISSDGVLSFNDAPDYEVPTDSDSANDYQVEITVFDSSNTSTSQTITVSITDTQDNAPMFTNDGGESLAVISLDENESEVTTITATDLDAINAGFTYQITGGDDSTLFSILESGVLSFNDAPDYEVPTDSDSANDYQVEITVFDSSNTSTSQTITVSITDTQDNAPMFTNDGGESLAVISLDENESEVTTITATDLDAINAGFTYQISGGEDQAFFSISEDGALSFKTALTYENPEDHDANNSYIVEVSVKDSSGATVSQMITVNIINVTLMGQFSYGPVEGLYYETTTESGFTDAQGTFAYREGETITFSIGDTVLGEAIQGKASISPLDLVTGASLPTDTSETRYLYDNNDTPEAKAFNIAHNIIALLQAFDADNNLDNGIYITSDAAELVDVQIDLNLEYVKFHEDKDVKHFLYSALNMGYLTRAYIAVKGRALDHYYQQQGIITSFKVPNSNQNDSDGNGTIDSLTSYSYNVKGYLTHESKDNNNDGYADSINSFTYNADGSSLYDVKDNDADDIPNEIMIYTYDNNGNRISMQFDKNNDSINDDITTSSFDMLGNKTKEVYENINSPSLNRTLTFTYDNKGNTLTETRVGWYPYHYEKTYNEQRQELSIKRDQDGDSRWDDIVHYSYNEQGLRSHAEEDWYGDGTEDANYTYSYDGNANLLQILYIEVADEAQAYTTQYSYDENGNKLSEQGYLFDGTKDYEQTWEYDDSGRELTEYYDRDGDGEVDRIYSYQYDSSGNILVYSRDNDGDGAPNSTYTYTYDTKGNYLTSSYDSNSDGIADSILSYTYDDEGNMLTRKRDSNADGTPNEVNTFVYPETTVSFNALITWLDD